MRQDQHRSAPAGNIQRTAVDKTRPNINRPIFCRSGFRTAVSSMTTAPTNLVPAGVDLSIRQFLEAWRILCTSCPGHTREIGEGIEYIFSGRSASFFNVAVLTGRGVSRTALKALGQAACTWAVDKDVPWLFLVTLDSLEPGFDPAAVLDDCGLAPVMPLVGMLAERLTPAPPKPEELSLQVPADDTAWATVIDVNSAAYDMDLGAGKDLLGPRLSWQEHFPVIGCVDGQPASSTTVLMADGYRYVAMVATVPERRLRGYADAVMRRALAEAAQVHGDRPTVLHATDHGRWVYEKMGYVPISTHVAFMEKRFLPPA